MSYMRTNLYTTHSLVRLTYQCIGTMYMYLVYIIGAGELAHIIQVCCTYVLYVCKTYTKKKDITL